MIIAFDTFFLAERFRNVGINEYAKNLFVEFQSLASKDSSIDIRHFVSHGRSEEPLSEKSTPGFTAVNTRLIDFQKLWRLGLVNFASVYARADLLFSPSPQILPWGLLPVAVTIHDAIPERLPREVVGASTVLRAMMRVAAKTSHKILTDSECSKKDLVEIYDLAPEKISVVYLGYDQLKFNSSGIDPAQQVALRSRLGIRGPYILHHGMVQLRKNLLKLVQAYKILLSRHPSFDFQLVFAGKLGFGSEQILRLADGLVSQDKVIFSGSLTDQELAVLVKGASLSVIPSLYEGFCLPLVESMACGVPTIAADASCLPEISGGTLRYFDPRSEEDMATTMQTVLDNRDLQTTLAVNGLRRASEFSWRRCAVETLGVLTSLNGRTGRPETKLAFAE
jgi:glycosyltransferase involved in cell wall biosynthesis